MAALDTAEKGRGNGAPRCAGGAAPAATDSRGAGRRGGRHSRKVSQQRHSRAMLLGQRLSDGGIL